MPKKRSNGDGGLYYIAKRGLWRGTVELGYGPDGRRKQKFVTSRTQRGAREKLDKLKREIAEHGAPLDRTVTLEEWADHWLASAARPHVDPNTFITYSSLSRRWIVPTIGRKKIVNLRPSDVRALRERIVVDGGLSSTTARQAHRVLSLMLDAAHAEGLCARNVAKDVKPPSKAAKKDRGRGAFTRDEALAILRAAMHARQPARWWAALTTGMRQGEALGLRWEDVDLERGLMLVSWSLDEVPREHGCSADPEAPVCGKRRSVSCPAWRWRIPDGFEMEPLVGRWTLIRPKGDKPREVPLLPPLVESLKRWREESADHPNPHGLVWPAADGTPAKPADDVQAWRDLLHAAGVIPAEQLKPASGAPGTHWARHTTVTVLLELGVDAGIVGEIVGHGSVEVTRDNYQHVSSAAAREAAERLGDRWAEALQIAP